MYCSLFRNEIASIVVDINKATKNPLNDEFVSIFLQCYAINRRSEESYP